MKAGIHLNTVVTTDVDYEVPADLPVVRLMLPRITRSHDSKPPRQVVKDATAGTAAVSPPPQVYDLEFDFEILAGSTIGPEGLLQLEQKALDLMAETPVLTVPRTDEAGAVIGTDDFEIVYSYQLQPVSADANSGVVAKRGSLTVRQVVLPSPVVNTEKLVTERVFDIYQT